MTNSASAQLFRRAEVREQRRQLAPYPPPPQYQRGEVRYEVTERYPQSSSYNRNRRISAMLGATVRTPNGEILGRIEDFVASEIGCIDYAIVSFSGMVGAGGRLAAVPWTLATMDVGQRTVTLDIERDRIREAPIFFDRNNWPDLYNHDWTERVSSFFGVEVATDEDQGFERARSERSSRGRSMEQQSDRDRSDLRSRRDAERDRPDYRSSRTVRPQEQDRDRTQYRGYRSPEGSRYQEQDSDRDQSNYRSRSSRSSDRESERERSGYRSSRSEREDEDSDRDRQNGRSSRTRSSQRSEQSDEREDSDSERTDLPE
jgi:hypothetical protein